MKWLFANEEEALTDSVFLKKVIISVVTILICITALCSATYALFSEDVSAGQNNIVSGNFDLAFSAEGAGGTVAVSETPEGKYTCTLTVPGTYTFTLAASADSTATKGYCLVTADGTTYRTAPVYREEGGELTFTVTTHEIGVKLIFTPIWGISAHEDIGNGGELVIEAQTKEE